MPGTFMTSADAVDREAGWLALPGTTQDGLPSLLTTYGGPWDVVQAYSPRTPAMRKAQVFVNRTDTHVERFGHIRSIFGYEFMLRLTWPLSNQQGNAESDQRAFDAAIHLLCLRIRGVGPNQPGGADKTHGGAFLQVAEGSDVTRTASGIHVHYEDPETTMSNGIDFRATISYSADDRDFND